MTVDRSLAVHDSLRQQLLRWLVPPVLLVALVSSFASYTIALSYANRAYDQSLFDDVKSLAGQVRFDPDGKPILKLPRVVEEILGSDPVDQIFYRVLSQSGDTIGGRFDLPPPRAPVAPDQPIYYDAMVGDAAVRVCAYRLVDDKTSGAATILVAETRIKRDTLSRSLLVSDFLVPMLALPVVIAVILWFGIRHGLGPLQRLTQTLAKRGWNDLGPISDHGVPQEIQPLTQSIDDLMERLGIALDAQQRFIAKAAHQLRTPLAGLAGQTERAMLANDIESVRPALAQLLLASQRATRLVNQLLILARAEPGSGGSCELKPLDLAALVQRTCMEWVPEALAKDVDLGYAGAPGPVTVAGDESLLAEMLNNLIDNALRYGAHPGSSVTVRLTNSTGIALAVEDDGPGIPEEERSRIFDRFHRVPGSPPGGSGLGLAIVREIARAHGAEVSVHRAKRVAGSVFRIDFGPA